MLARGVHWGASRIPVSGLPDRSVPASDHVKSAESLTESSTKRYYLLSRDKGMICLKTLIQDEIHKEQAARLKQKTSASLDGVVSVRTVVRSSSRKLPGMLEVTFSNLFHPACHTYQLRLLKSRCRRLKWHLCQMLKL